MHLSLTDIPQSKNEAAEWVRQEANALIEQAERRAKGWDKGPFRDDDTLCDMTIDARNAWRSDIAFTLAKKWS